MLKVGHFVENATPPQFALNSLSLRPWVLHPSTRSRARLLGPCFKTGRIASFCRRPHHREPSPAGTSKSRTNQPRRQGIARMHAKGAEQATPPLTQSASPVTVSSSFHSLFKVLSIFPSRYLFAIGLPPLFSL